MGHLVRLLAAVVCLAPAAYGASFAVTSPNDSGPGTLRQAILDANANPGPDLILFNIPAVSVTSSLPQITSPVEIDGNWSGPNRATINGVLFDCSRAFNFGTGSSGSALGRVIVTNFCESVRIGPGVTNVTVLGSTLGAVAINGDHNTIGGTGSADGNDINGILSIGAGDGNQVLRNDIVRIQILFGDGSRIGSAGNGNTVGSITMQSAGGTLIEGNTMNGAAFPAIEISNALPPAGGATITGNTIRNYQTGVLIHPSFDVASPAFAGATITGNSISQVGIAVDLGGDGSTPNDPAPDADSGPNDLQNFPVLTSAVATPSQLVVSGTLTSAPLSSYLVELFSNPASDPDATTPLGTFTIVIDGSGTATFTRAIAAPLPAGHDVITATATSAGGNTSEVSAPIVVDSPGQLGFVQTAYSVNETDGSVTVTVQRTGGSDGTVTVNYATVSGTAVAPADYQQQTGTLIFGPGVTARQIVIPIVADAIGEPDESFTLRLTAPSGGATLGLDTTTVTIVAQGAPAAVPTLSQWSLLALALGLAAAMLLRAR